ncbi:hypothetical protein LTS18_014594, partial [Coniosporium uncinatum]
EADVQGNAKGGLYEDYDADRLSDTDAEGSPDHNPLAVEEEDEEEEPVYDSDDPDRPPTVEEMTTFTKEAFAALTVEVVKKMGRKPWSYYLVRCREFGVVPKGIEKGYGRINDRGMVWGKEKRFWKG